MSRLAWQAHLRPAVLPPDYLVLLAENAHHIFEGAAYVQAAPLLDGSRSDDEIHAHLESSGVPSFAAWLALGHLRALGLLRDTDADDCVSYSRAVVRDAGGTGAGELRRALETSGLQVSGEPRPSDLVIVVADDYLDPRLEQANRDALETGGAWMAVKLAGTVPWIGPLFVPGRTGCWACLAQRLRLNRQTEQFVEAQFGPSAKAPLPALRSSLTLAAELAAAEALRWLTTNRHEGLEGGLLTLDLKTNSLLRHVLVRRPQCPVCGEARSHSPSVELHSSPKRAAGGRSESSEATLARFEHHVSPITGPVRSLTESNENGYLHVSAAQTFPMYRFDFRVLRDNLLGRSGGKGLDAAEARASALCEALERYSGAWRGEEEQTVVAASQRELGEQALDLTTLLGFSARQYAEREPWNTSSDEPHAWVPKPFDRDLAIDWTPVWSLAESRARLVPAAYCYYGHPELRHMFCSSDSNGCAAGGTLAEAVAHGLLELIERDAAAIWWYNCVPRAAIDLDSFALPVVRDLRELYRSQNRSFWALDLTNDLGVPVIAAVSARLDSPREDIIYGFGSDLDPASAVTKAVLEMNQSLFAVYHDAAAGPTGYRTDQAAARRWFASATRADLPYLAPDPAAPPKTRDDFACAAHSDWRDDALDCVERLRRANLETFVLDQTRPDIGLPVARVLVPGLCHFWRRFGSPRLYQVPVTMGWRTSPKSEDELNPWFIYF